MKDKMEVKRYSILAFVFFVTGAVIQAIREIMGREYINLFVIFLMVIGAFFLIVAINKWMKSKPSNKE